MSNNSTTRKQIQAMCMDKIYISKITNKKY